MLSITQCEITLPQTTPKTIQPLERCRDQKKSPMPRPATTVGLRRFGYSDTQVRALHQAYRLMYREGLIVKEALVKIEALKADFPDAVEQLTRFIEFIGSSPRGVIR